jgi:hypothetical protein
VENRPTAAQRRHFRELALAGCCICKRLGFETSVAEIHHWQDGMLGKRDHNKVIALCERHHRLGSTALHNMGKDNWLQYFGVTLEELLELSKPE